MKEKGGKISCLCGRKCLHMAKQIRKGSRRSRLWDSAHPSREIQTGGVWSQKQRYFFSSEIAFHFVNTFIPVQTQVLPIYPWNNNDIDWSYNINIPPVLKELSGGLRGNLLLFKELILQWNKCPTEIISTESLKV